MKNHSEKSFGNQMRCTTCGIVWDLKDKPDTIPECTPRGVPIALPEREDIFVPMPDKLREMTMERRVTIFTIDERTTDEN